MLKIVSVDPFLIKMHKPILFYHKFWVLFAAYLEELVKTMVMVMFASLYFLLHSYCIPIR